jgi:putative FmdB family regulatory protein
MPTYEFRCKTCDSVFEERRSMSESNAPATCPEGHPGAVRLLSVFASVGGRQASSTSSADVAAAMSAPRAGGCGGGCACH